MLPLIDVLPWALIPKDSDDPCGHDMALTLKQFLGTAPWATEDSVGLVIAEAGANPMGEDYG